MKFSIREQLADRILVLDGGLGTLVQGHNLSEEDFRGGRFASWRTPLKGCNDVLVLTAPDVIQSIHEAYLHAGADIISTDTFNSNAISLADYQLHDHVYDINRAAASLARRLAEKFSLSNPTKPRFVAGSIGPTSKSASMPSDFSNLASRSVTFDELVEAYTPQVRGLAEGGVDLFLIETAFDGLNVKAALVAIARLELHIPVMVSGTISDASGRILSGQTVEALYTAVAHTPNLLSIGLNCALGAEQMLPFVERLAATAECYVSAHPNAGLPNIHGEYDQTPRKMGAQLEDFMQRGLLNIVGGCCGTTPAHIAAIAGLAAKASPRRLPEPRHRTMLSGLDVFEVSPERNFINIGERANVAGSAKFARLIRENKLDEALSIARGQVAAGAQVVDVCMDDALIDGPAAITRFLNLLAIEAEVASVPVMIDSSKWETLLAGLSCTQGKSIVNSISLKEGEEEFLSRAATIRSYGAAAVVMLFDEKGQADTFERKTAVARRAYDLLTGAGFPAEDIIFDPNVLAVATGIPEHDGYGVAFIEAVRWIKQNLPYAKTSGGISNLSFAFRGNNTVREAMHSVFLYHAVEAGLDMGIVNPAMLQVYSDIPAELLELCEDVVLNRRPDAAERLMAFADKLGAPGGKPEPAAAQNAWRNGPLSERIERAMLKGIVDHIEADTREAYAELGTPMAVIDRLLMPSMERV
ncbi:MAG: homocysteine S-methyltransferase family protein, partial [Rikenellaceae bacterium]|nr:homocysteine S-methyltransferase family protein [Rikenellaceae bacterium]